MIHSGVYSEKFEMVRVNITFDRETLRMADREARRRKTSRSEFIRVAIRAAVTDHEREAEALREQRGRAIEGMRRLARKAGDWPAERILRQWRDRWRGVKR